MNNPGVDPPPALFNFPTALAFGRGLEPSDRHAYLFVASSNFDLRYNAGTLLTIDLAALRIRLSGCTAATPCEFPDLAARELLVQGGEVRIGSFTSDMGVSSSGDRIYVTTRTDASITYIEVVPGAGTLSCGNRTPGAAIPSCDDAHRRTDNTIAAQRLLATPRDPLRMAIGPLADLGASPNLGDYILVADRSGAVSLYVDPARTEGATRHAPSLLHVLSGLPDNLTGLAFDPPSGVLYATSARSDQIARAGVSIEMDNFQRSRVQPLPSLRLRGLDFGTDVRDIAFADAGRAYLVTRSPEALVAADFQRAGVLAGEVPIAQVVPVGRGPSRLEMIGSDFAVVVSFDAKELTVIDLGSGAPVATVPGFLGPHDIAYDPDHRQLFVADFRDSTVRVVDMAGLFDADPTTSPRIIATLGLPRPVLGLR